MDSINDMDKRLGRPMIGKGKREAITVTLDPEVIAQLDGKVGVGGSRSWMVETALRQMLGMIPSARSAQREDEE